MMKLPQIIKTISKILKKQNTKAIIVGGAVRDHFLDVASKDMDIEVYGLASIDDLELILKQYGSVTYVGKSFAVLKFTYKTEVYDFSFPRLETKTGQGHRGFSVNMDGNLDFLIASKRRDFRINALGYDIEKAQFIDPFGGLEDIKNKTLRHIDEVTFIEDPLRVYRAIQFSARFTYKLAEETLLLCKYMVEEGMLEELSKERVYSEWAKLLLKSTQPSYGFELMKKLGILKRYFPELYTLVGLKQSPLKKFEIDIWTHTMLCVDAMARLVDENETLKLQYMFAILCHHLGKDTKSFMCRLTNRHTFIEKILPLVEHYLKPSQFYEAQAKDSAIRKLATKVSIEELVVVAKADFLGGTREEPSNKVYHAGVWLLKKAKELNVDKKPLDNMIQGKDLIALGFMPSPKFKKILDSIYDLQLEGTLKSKDEALVYIKKTYS